MKNKEKREMRKIRNFLLLVLLFIPLFLNSLEMSYKMEMSYLPNYGLKMYDSELRSRLVSDHSFYVNMETYVHMNWFYIGGGIKTHFWKDEYKDFSFFPDESFYKFELGATFDFVTIGYRHECFHPIVPNYNDVDVKSNWEGYLNEIFIRFSGKTGR